MMPAPTELIREAIEAPVGAAEEEMEETEADEEAAMGKWPPSWLLRVLP